jgi:divalent metal cation (Fe/Co/Zn/Cd) transporter
VGFLITSATIIAYESVINIRTPHELPKPWTLLVLGAIIIWKEYSFRVVLKEVFKIVPLLEPMLGTIAAMQLHQ